jgi:alkylated DNA repair protein (DNA oxidative demethylase)
MEYNLFENLRADASGLDPMAEGAVLLRGKVLAFEYDLLPALRTITEQASFRHTIMPGGFTMSVAMTNCGRASCAFCSTI